MSFPPFFDRYQQILHRNLVYLATIADSNQNMQSLLPAVSHSCAFRNNQADFSSSSHAFPLLPSHLFSHIRQGTPKKGRGVVTSPNLALASDFGDGCIEVYGRFMKKYTKTQHNCNVWWENHKSNKTLLLNRSLCEMNNSLIKKINKSISNLLSEATFILWRHFFIKSHRTYIYFGLWCVSPFTPIGHNSLALFYFF